MASSHFERLADGSYEYVHVLSIFDYLGMFGFWVVMPICIIAAVAYAKSDKHKAWAAEADRKYWDTYSEHH